MEFPNMYYVGDTGYVLLLAMSYIIVALLKNYEPIYLNSDGIIE